MTTKELLLGAWDASPVVPSIALLALAGYGVHFRQRLGWRSAFFAAAAVVFFVALSSPIGVLARGYLFSAHMLEHLLLVLAVPPLVLLGLPRERSRPAAAGDWTARAAAVSWAGGVGAMWVWHERALCNAAATSPAMQWVQTTSLVALGLVFWRPILAPRLSDRMPPLAGVVYLFAACVACTVLGVIVTLSPVEVCSAYVHPVDALGVLPLLRDGWGVTARADQEIGGLLMWVPACLVYASAILATLGRYYGEEHAPAPTGAAR